MNNNSSENEFLKSEVVKMITNFSNSHDSMRELMKMGTKYGRDESSPLFIFFNHQEENLLKVSKCMVEMNQFILIMNEFLKDEKTLFKWKYLTEEAKGDYFLEMAEKKMKEKEMII